MPCKQTDYLTGYLLTNTSYHTALVFNNIEYFFGRGIQTCLPGTTHHGQPMQKIALGQTQLPMDVILDYLESLKTIYTAESYDLFLHNCNNFSHDFSMFLVGKGIPDHITSLPQTVMNTPFGQMLKPQLDQAMRGITQAPVVPPPQSSTSTNGVAKTKILVQRPTSLSTFMPLFEQSLGSCAVLFFTSPTCPPCRICYEPFEALASEFEGQATLMKIDVSEARDIAARYSIRATPTFITFLHGEQVDKWSGADVGKLQANTRLLVQMANPPHPHTQLQLTTLHKEHKPHVYSKLPPIEKLTAKLEASVRSTPEVEELVSFIKQRSDTSKIANVPIPNLAQISQLIRQQALQKPPLTIFPLVDLFRLALLDVRVSGYFAEEPKSTSLIYSLIDHGSRLKIDAASYPFLLTTTQALSNTFTSRLSFPSIISAPELHTIVSNGLLATTHPALRATASNLIFNIASAHHREIIQTNQPQQAATMGDSLLVEFIVSSIEALNQELDRNAQADKETTKTLVMSIGLLLYGSSPGIQDELKSVLQAIEAKVTLERAGKIDGLSTIVKDVLLVLP